jgi:hypothetical protein
MKKFTAIGLWIVVAVLVGLLFWNWVQVSRDKNFSQKLAGTWSWQFANIRETYNYSIDGSFTDQEVLTHSKNTNIYQMAGTWQIKDGKIFETITNDSHKGARVPRTHSAQIIRLDAHKYIVAINTNKMVLNKVTP